MATCGIPLQTVGLAVGHNAATGRSTVGPAASAVVLTMIAHGSARGKPRGEPHRKPHGKPHGKAHGKVHGKPHSKPRE